MAPRHATRLRLLALPAALALSGCAAGPLGMGVAVPPVPKPVDGVLVSGADGLPDFQRGVTALADGRPEDAERDLRPLAERGYPDAALQLGAAYAERDTLAAEAEALAWYRRALPQRPEADVGMARVLMATGKRADAVEALRLIRKAKSSRGEPQADSLLLALFMLHPELDTAKEASALAERNARSPLTGSRRQAVSWYRINLGAGDNVFRLRKVCEAHRQSVPGCYADLVRFSRYGGQPERLDALVAEALVSFEALIALPVTDITPVQQATAVAQAAAQLALSMVDQLDVVDVQGVYDTFADARIETEARTQDVQTGADPLVAPTVAGAPVATAASLGTPTRPDLADRVVRWMLKRSAVYVAYAGEVINRHPFLVPDVDLVAALRPVAESGNHEGTLQLGAAYSTNLRGQIDAVASERHLLASLAFRSTRQRAHYQLARLYERGFLREPEPDKIVEHLLAGVRGGDLRSAARLARVFYGAPGIRTNRVGAYVFARLAEDTGRPVLVIERGLADNLASSSARAPTALELAGRRTAVRMLDRLRVELTAEELAEGDRLYATEKALQPTPPPPIPPDIYARRPAS